MQIYASSTARGGDSFLHAGYTSARSSDYGGDQFTFHTPSLLSTDYQYPRQPLADAAVLLLFFIGIVLLRYMRGVPVLRRRLATLVLVSLTTVALLLPACSAALGSDSYARLFDGVGAMD